MSFMLALPKISLHGQGAIEDMVAMLATKQHGKALIGASLLRSFQLRPLWILFPPRTGHRPS